MKAKFLLILVVCISLLVWYLNTSRHSYTGPQTAEMPAADQRTALEKETAGAIPTTSQNMLNGVKAPYGPPDPGPVPERVREVVDLEAEPLRRMASLQKLTQPLNESEVSALYAFLRERHGEDESQLGHVVKNEIMTILTEAHPLPPGCEELFVQICKDETQHIVIRDYALQHLPRLYQTTESAKGLIEGTINEALSETGSSLAGTSLLALRALASTTPEISLEKVGSAAVGIMTQAAAGELAKITAIQICAEQDRTETLPVLVSLARTGNSTALRISAVAAIGRIGTKAEMRLLGEILEEKNQRLVTVATMALNSMQRRFTPQ